MKVPFAVRIGESDTMYLAIFPNERISNKLSKDVSRLLICSFVKRRNLATINAHYFWKRACRKSEDAHREALKRDQKKEYELAYADPKVAMGYAYVTNQMGAALTGDRRDVALRDALSAIGGLQLHVPKIRLQSGKNDERTNDL